MAVWHQLCTARNSCPTRYTIILPSNVSIDHCAYSALESNVLPNTFLLTVPCIDVGAAWQWIFKHFTMLKPTLSMTPLQQVDRYFSVIHSMILNTLNSVILPACSDVRVHTRSSEVRDSSQIHTTCILPNMEPALTPTPTPITPERGSHHHACPQGWDTVHRDIPVQTLRPHLSCSSDKVTINIILPTLLDVKNGSVRSSLLSVPAADQTVRGAPSVTTCQNQFLPRVQTILPSSPPSPPSPSSSHHRSQPFHHS